MRRHTAIKVCSHHHMWTTWISNAPLMRQVEFKERIVLVPHVLWKGKILHDHYDVSRYASYLGMYTRGTSILCTCTWRLRRTRLRILYSAFKPRALKFKWASGALQKNRSGLTVQWIHQRSNTQANGTYALLNVSRGGKITSIWSWSTNLYSVYYVETYCIVSRREEAYGVL